MDYIWTPWRYQYMKEVEAGQQPECIFCDASGAQGRFRNAGGGIAARKSSLF